MKPRRRNRGDDQMRRSVIFLLASGILALASASIFARQQKDSGADKASNGAPLKLVGKYEFPSSVTGRFDHLLVDLKTQRMFTTPQSAKAVMVFDLKTREMIHTIAGIENPHHLLYREDLNRLYVTDGGNGGALRIIDGKTYEFIKSVPLLPDADPSIYDPATKLLYVESGGKDANMDYSTINIINTTSGKNLGTRRVNNVDRGIIHVCVLTATLDVEQLCCGIIDTWVRVGKKRHTFDELIGFPVNNPKRSSVSTIGDVKTV